jgi:uncharacterized phage protein gp47/JayE
MTTIYGVTPTGFVMKPLVAIKADLEGAYRASYGQEIDLSPAGPMGLEIGINAERIAEVWQLAQAVYSSEYPDSATGVPLDEVASITGTTRLPATYSTVPAVLIGTPGTVVGSGRVVGVVNAGARFATDSSATLATVLARLGTHAYVPGDLIAVAGKIYACSVAGTSAAGAPAFGTAADLTDGTAHWCYVGTGTAAAAVACAAQSTGPLVAPTQTLTVILTPVAGLASVSNYADATLGRNIESDAALRERREQELRAEGNAALDSIRAKLLEVAGVVSVTVFENQGDVINADGVPPHSIEALVLGGDTAAICKVIFDTKAGGIGTAGSTGTYVIDAQGASHLVNFSRPTQVPVYVSATLTKQPSGYPADGDAEVAAAIVAFANGSLADAAGVPVNPGGYRTGDDVVTSKLYTPIELVSGIYDVTSIRVGLAASPGSSANIAIGPRALAVFDTARIVVTST